MSHRCAQVHAHNQTPFTSLARQGEGEPKNQSCFKQRKRKSPQGASTASAGLVAVGVAAVTHPDNVLQAPAITMPPQPVVRHAATRIGYQLLQVRPCVQLHTLQHRHAHVSCSTRFSTLHMPTRIHT
eukprot:GHVS01061028.1.p1 GENE.GHVS01061028.1~~GHVS01061028.1.p1  ORF type:complete len:127 (+),score=7.80 GHVS01061028.1:36-416(+)